MACLPYDPECRLFQAVSHAGSIKSIQCSIYLKKIYLVKNKSKVHVYVLATVMPTMQMQVKWLVQRDLGYPLLKKIERLAWSEKRD
jgi:hypothetical protein